MSVLEQLQQGLAEIGSDLDERAQQRIIAYLAMLERWNRVYNLTAIRDSSRMVAQHILDSLVILAHFPDNVTRVLDVGSGGGLPGIPIAIARPEWQVLLLDSNHKKTTFLRQAAIELELENISVETQRVEAFTPSVLFDVVISRAFADLAEFARLAGHLLAPGGCLIAMKGVYPHEELAQLPPAVAVEQVFPLKVPGLDAARHLVVMRAA